MVGSQDNLEGTQAHVIGQGPRFSALVGQVGEQAAPLGVGVFMVSDAAQQLPGRYHHRNVMIADPGNIIS